jgi:hypothetical protein
MYFTRMTPREKSICFGMGGAVFGKTAESFSFFPVGLPAYLCVYCVRSDHLPACLLIGLHVLLYIGVCN